VPFSSTTPIALNATNSTSGTVHGMTIMDFSQETDTVIAGASAHKRAVTGRICLKIRQVFRHAKNGSLASKGKAT